MASSSSERARPPSSLPATPPLNRLLIENLSESKNALKSWNEESVQPSQNILHLRGGEGLRASGLLIYSLLQYCQSHCSGFLYYRKVPLRTAESKIKEEARRPTRRNLRAPYLGRSPSFRPRHAPDQPAAQVPLLLPLPESLRHGRGAELDALGWRARHSLFGARRRLPLPRRQPVRL